MNNTSFSANPFPQEYDDDEHSGTIRSVNLNEDVDQQPPLNSPLSFNYERPLETKQSYDNDVFSSSQLKGRTPTVRQPSFGGPLVEQQVHHHQAHRQEEENSMVYNSSNSKLSHLTEQQQHQHQQDPSSLKSQFQIQQQLQEIKELTNLVKRQSEDVEAMRTQIYQTTTSNPCCSFTCEGFWTAVCTIITHACMPMANALEDEEGKFLGVWSATPYFKLKFCFWCGPRTGCCGMWCKEVPLRSAVKYMAFLQILSSTGAALSTRLSYPASTAQSIVEVWLSTYMWRAIDKDLTSPVQHFAFSMILLALAGFMQAFLGFMCIFACDDQGRGWDAFSAGLGLAFYKSYYSYIVYCLVLFMRVEAEGWIRGRRSRGGGKSQRGRLRDMIIHTS